MLDFWKRVRKHIAGDFTQTWLCEETGLATSTMSNWVSNDRIPPADKAQKIANALGVTVEYLVTGKEPYEDFEEENQSSTPVITEDPKGGVPFYDYEVTAHISDILDTTVYTPKYFVHYEPFRGTDLCMPVAGDSMHPDIKHGDVLALKRLNTLGEIMWGETYVIVTHGDMELCAVKCVHPNPKNVTTIILRSINPAYSGDKIIEKESIHEVYKVKGLLRVSSM